MANSGSIISPMKFLGYKIDRLNFDVKNYVDIITRSDFQGDWEFSASFRKPMFMVSKNLYIGGLELNLIHYKELRSIDTGEMNRHPVVEINSGIIGSFSFEEKINQDQEKVLVERQIPTILFPFLRAAITSTIANCGLGSVLLPLINVNEMAKNSILDGIMQVD
jgi:hypothetical protein